MYLDIQKYLWAKKDITVWKVSMVARGFHI